MKSHLALLLCLSLIASCKNNQRQQEIVSQMQAATAEKIEAENNLADFKARNGSIFKEYDSIKNKGVVPVETQTKHDSLVTEGVKLAMKVVHDQMKIDSLQKIR